MNFKAIILAIATVFSVQTTWAEPATEKSIRELLVATGAGNMAVQVMNGMIPPMKKAIPKAPDVFWEEFMKEVNADDLINMIVPIYQKHYSEEDIQTISAFYKTPAGQRMVATMPIVMQESMQIGQQWGRKIGERVLERAKQQNLIPAK
jgi:uncharacterized protein